MPDFIDNTIEYIINNPKDFVNICFWMITAFLAIITYRNAKKTLFNPIRSEMVKYQMKVITEFIDNHTSKGQDFDNSVDYSNLLKITYETDYLFYFLTNELEFGNHQFDPIHNERLNYCRENMGGLFELNTERSHLKFQLVSGDFDSAKQYVQTGFIKEKEAIHVNLGLQRLYLTKRFYTFYTDLLNLKSNPFIPKKIKNIIDELISNILRNLGMLHEVLSDHISKQTDAKYQTIYSQFTANKINHHEDLEKLYIEIARFFKVNI